MRTKIISVLFVCTSLQIMAQEKETTIKTFGKAITDEFPSTRAFDLQYEQLGPTQFSSKLFGEDFEKGKIDNHNRLQLAINVPFYKSKSKRFVLTSSFRYKYEAFTFDEIYYTNDVLPHQIPTQDFHYWAGALTGTYITSLFKKPIIYNATITVDGNQENAQRIKGFVAATLVLKKTENTTITVGLMGVLDPSAILPVVPIFTYSHNFSNSKWKIDAVIPKSVFLRRKLLNHGRLSLGTELSTENFYLNLKTTQLNDIYELNTFALQSGLTYEYRFSNKMIGTFKTGINNTVNTRITEKGDRTDKYIYDQKQDSQAYFKIGISYNPF